MPSSLRIPAPYQPGLQALADMGDESAAALLEALRDETRLLTTDRLAEHVGDCVPELAGSANDIIEALLSLITLLPEEGNGAEQLASDVAYSQDLEIDDAPRAEFSARLQAMLEIESLAVAARASDVVTEYGRVFHDARILNDLRPVFGPDPKQGPKAATLIATLKIDYHPPRGSLDSEFYALEHADLLRLRDVVDRAIAKHASLRHVMDKMSLPYWEYLEVPSDLDD
jgi:DNA-binding transcriptional ArsR family regulator